MASAPCSSSSSSSSFPTSTRRRRYPLSNGNGFFLPSELSGTALVRGLFSLASEISTTTPPRFLQRRNALTLVRRARTLLALLEPLRDTSVNLLPPPTSLCLRELYILLYRSKSLLDHLSSPPNSRLWLLLLNPRLSSLFHDLSLETSTLLDLLPVNDLPIPPDARRNLLLLRRHARSSRLHIDPDDESLRIKLHSFLSDLRVGILPRPRALRYALVSRLGISDARTCRFELDSIEDLLHTSSSSSSATQFEDDLDLFLLEATAALARYALFRLFGFSNPSPLNERRLSVVNGRIPSIKSDRGGFGPIPKEFCCPISLDLMRDPVIASTGQTYDRTSISRWMDEGHNTCPNSGQTLSNKRLVPNRALRNLISYWCSDFAVNYDAPEPLDPSETVASIINPAAVVANRATADLLIERLNIGTNDQKTVAAKELRLLAKNGKENRIHIAQAGAVPLLARLLSSTNDIAQENAVTAILNLSIHDKNKSRVMEVDGCLTSIVGVLRRGLTTEARENAAAALFSLSAVHDYKKMIGDEDGALEALAGLLREGTPRGKRDAVTALFNLSTHAECSHRMVASGAVEALVDALATDGVVEEAAGALGVLVRRPSTASAVAVGGRAVPALVGLMRLGSPRGKENAVAALAEMCRSGGAAVTEIVAAVPSISGLIQSQIFTGTKRARRKAASLARSFQKYDAGGEGFAAMISFARGRYRPVRGVTNSDGNGNTSSFAGEDVADMSSVSVHPSVSISVPVL